MIVVGMGLNSSFGVRVDGVRVTEAVAVYLQSERQSLSGILAEQLCLKQSRCSPSTWAKGGGPAFFGGQGGHSSIDHCFRPQAALGNILGC
eukprot:3921663-Pyramimonas_sp.AAC.1